MRNGLGIVTCVLHVERVIVLGAVHAGLPLERERDHLRHTFAFVNSAWKFIAIPLTSFNAPTKCAVNVCKKF